MESLGEYLRRERKLRNISLEEISRSTRINIRLLEALEGDRYELLPPKIFVKGFLKAYTNYVGLDYDDVLLRYDTLLEDGSEQKFKTLYPEIEVRRQRHWWILPVMLLLIGGGFLSYSYWKGPNKGAEEKENVQVVSEELKASRTRNEVPSKVEISMLPSTGVYAEIGEGVEIKLEETGKKKGRKAPTEAAEASKKAKAKKEPAKRPERMPAKEPKEASPLPAKYTLVGRVNAMTWIKYYIDDKEPREILLRAGETFTWKAQKALKLVIGNAGGIDLSLNGVSLKPLGKPGEVVVYKVP